MLTDSCKLIEEGSISLSGKSVGIDGVGVEVISTLTGGDAVVEFKAIDDAAKALVKNKLGKDYVENAEDLLLKQIQRLRYMQTHPLQSFLLLVLLRIST